MSSTETKFTFEMARSADKTEHRTLHIARECPVQVVPIHSVSTNFISMAFDDVDPRDEHTTNKPNREQPICSTQKKVDSSTKYVITICSTG